MTRRTRGTWLAASLLALSLWTTHEARADVERTGTWPAQERKISLELEQTPLRLALKRLADVAGWSIVLPGHLDDLVDVQVKEQDAGRVLDLLLQQRRYVAHRDGDLLQVRLATPQDAAAPALPAPPTAPALPALPDVPALPAMPALPDVPALPAVPALAASASSASPPELRPEAEDRTVIGGSARVARGEVVKHLTVLGGSVQIEGEVTGEVTVLGGSVRVKEGAHVHGTMRAIGGSVKVEDGARVDGALEAFGGIVDGGPGARKKKALAATSDATVARKSPRGFLEKIGNSLSSAALLYVFGVVLWALQTERMERLQTEVASRPMRSFAVGVVGLLGGSLLLAAMSVTIVGIPVAIVLAIAGVLGAYAGLCAALQTAGKGLLAHRTTNPYLHLAAGCALFFLTGSLPWIGDLVGIFGGLLGLGVALTTGFGGMTRPLLGASTPQGPYRTSP
ncbi:MAG: polymer-forming cytoskeletal protein [Polyangiaceae bacterium]|jgi:hypothetical protein|nr:polymer-forming cytoskeletal protein [Polyangiaceae bacterium]